MTKNRAKIVRRVPLARIAVLVAIVPRETAVSAVTIGAQVEIVVSAAMPADGPALEAGPSKVPPISSLKS